MNNKQYAKISQNIAIISLIKETSKSIILCKKLGYEYKQNLGFLKQWANNYRDNLIYIYS